MPEHSENGRRISHANAAIILTHHYIKPPMQAIFNAPMRTHCMGKRFGIRLKGVNAVCKL